MVDLGALLETLGSGILQMSGVDGAGQLAFLEQGGLSREEGLRILLERRPGVLAKARLLAEVHRFGVPDPLLSRFAHEAGVHWISVMAEDRAMHPGGTVFKMTDPDSGLHLLALPDGRVVVHGVEAEDLPAGLASRNRVEVDQVQDLKGLHRVPDTPRLLIRGPTPRHLDLRGSTLRFLACGDAWQLRSVTTGPLQGLTIMACKQLKEISVLGRVRGDVEISLCPSLERLRIDGGVGNSLQLSTCPRLATLPDPLDVSRFLKLYEVGVSALPSSWRAHALVGNSLPELRSLGGPSGRLRMLSLRDCPALVQLPDAEGIEHLSLDGLSSLEVLPAGICVTDLLYLGHCPAFRAFQPGFRPPPSLVLDGLPRLETLPERGAPYQSLRLKKLPVLRKLPRDLAVVEPLTVEGCPDVEDVLEGLAPEG